ncbi:MAG: Polysaccharide pyruvyl transferase [Methanomassiliicoccales archaeon PtaU1.Bin124]|nr:MAG: Polysaccharide pyruvyl transferase [Methanomassiliicoccales archaeon PtaU1.Bin124]
MDNGKDMRIVLVGYNGANNTGSEARLLKIIDDIRRVCGPDTHITVPSLNVENLRRYVNEDEHLHIESIPSIYHLTLRRLIKQSDLMMLVEGSCYMDTWTSSLLSAYLWATRCADSANRSSLAYAVDAGDLRPENVGKVKEHASKTDLIVTRTFNAAERLNKWGVTAPIKVTADPAFDFGLGGTNGTRLNGKECNGRVGMALVDFNLWPVVARPFGRKCNCYRWPYYFSRSKDRVLASRLLADGFAKLADEIVEKYDKDVVLISMESLDEPLAREVLSKMKHPECAVIRSSRELNAFQMTNCLRRLDALITSRYHAAVLSMASAVPMMAIGHDRRLDDLFAEIGIRDELFFRAGQRVDWEGARKMVDTIMQDGARIKATIRKGYDEQIARMAKNRVLLGEFLAERGCCHGG